VVEDEKSLDDKDPEAIKLLAEEAAKFVGDLPAKRIRKKPVDNFTKIIAEAYEQDEKKELIKELGIWKKTLATEAAAAGVVWPTLKVSMEFSFIREQHDAVRRKLNLESSDDEESSEEEEDAEDETVEEEEMEEESSSESSSEEDEESEE
jgi:hypothetical protein